MKVFYSEAYIQGSHEFDTTRKAGWIADSMTRDQILGVEIVEPAPAIEEDLETVHDPAYVAAVRDGHPRMLAESQGFRWDPGLWQAACASTGGAVAAALAALDDGVAGSLSSGLHHARRDRGAGFCTFNGLALAARASSLKTSGPVLILDLDAHCGGGTYSLIADLPQRVWQADISVNQFDHYSATDDYGYLDVVRSARAYLPAVQAALAAAERERWSLVIYNAGMDPHEGSSVGGLAGITGEVLTEREHLVFKWASTHGFPIAFVLAGGYSGSRLPVPALADLHRLTISAGARGGVVTESVK